MKKLNIATACFVNAQQELLVVRKRNTQAWMLPGGKLDAGETASQALVRELHEELQMTVAPASLHWLGDFEAPAANEAHTTVHAQVFVVPLPEGQTPVHAAEIAEMQWLPLHAPLPANLAPLLRTAIIPALHAQA